MPSRVPQLSFLFYPHIGVIGTRKEERRINGADCTNRWSCRVWYVIQKWAGRRGEGVFHVHSC